MLMTFREKLAKNSLLNRRIWKMSWPPMLSNITTPLLGLVDTAVVGHLANESHLGAVAIGASVLALSFGHLAFCEWGQRV